MSSSLKIPAPATVVLGYRQLGANANSTLVFGTYLNNSQSGNTYAFILEFSSTTTLRLVSSYAGGVLVTSGFFVPTVGVDYVFVITFGISTWNFSAYPVNGGAPSFSNGTWSSNVNPVYSATAQIGFGSAASFSRVCNYNIYFGGLYNRALSQTEAQTFAANPWQIFKSPGGFLSSPRLANPYVDRSIHFSMGMQM